ncbi:uncharacterized protein LOC102714810 [Oryza brachyantha]|uniref:uncharacterized protein LOC102714810 n=1 Tax=Oryza brachyantha TaxID=4533 RepID=UPI0003EA848A|nr:uncharacterized protein LOC102714810 [Oryza brachyantha]
MEGSAVEGQRRRRRLPSSVDKVLGNDDLLGVILLRTGGCPVTLVRAALVCRGWYRHASLAAFLRRFRERHGRPRLLGFYVQLGHWTSLPRFSPLPGLPQELAAMVRRARLDVESYGGAEAPWICTDLGCWNGRLHISVCSLSSSSSSDSTVVCHPLLPGREWVVLPPSPDRMSFYCDGVRHKFLQFHGFVPNLGGSVEDGLPYIFLTIGTKQNQTIAHVYAARDGGRDDSSWSVLATAVAEKPFFLMSNQQSKVVLLDGAVYAVAKHDDGIAILKLCISSSTFSVTAVPDHVLVEGEFKGAFMLSPADDDSSSGIYLINCIGTQLNIWLHKTSSRSSSNGETNDDWTMVDTIMLETFWGTEEDDYQVDQEEVDVDEHVVIHAVTANADFVFFERYCDGIIYLLDVRARAAQKVYEHEASLLHHRVLRIRPFTMLWPPTFPALKEDDPDATSTVGRCKVFYVDVRRNIVEGVRGDIEGGALPVIHQLMMVWPCYLPSAGIDQGS